MGYNTALMLCNDGLDTLVRDPNAGQKIHDAVIQANAMRPVTVSLANHCNPMMILPPQHADMNQLVMVGGNMIRPVAGFFRMGYHADQREFQEVVLGRLARELGYAVVPRKTGR